jgi:hypothetical protein
MVHNEIMVKFVCMLFVALSLMLFSLPVALAQDTAPVEDGDDSSEQVEQKDDSYRRQMELEDARSRDRTYIDNTHSQKADLEKIDKLPEESRENIRAQLVDVIMENGEWEPKDALEEYPYAPTEAAQSDPELMEREQEAWDEQIEKYHAREAAAFGTYRGPVPGPGNPAGQQGDGSQQGQQGGQQGSGQDGAGDGESGDGSEGTYQPYQSGSNGSEDEVSTAGVSESALDFLRGGQGRQQPPPQSAQPQPPQAQPQSQQAQEQATGDQQAQAEEQAPEESSEQAQTDQAAEQGAEQKPEQAQAEQQQESPQDIQLDTRGIIAIKDLDKLEGTEIPGDQEDSEDP